MNNAKVAVFLKLHNTNTPSESDEVARASNVALPMWEDASWRKNECCWDIYTLKLNMFDYGRSNWEAWWEFFDKA